MESDLLLELIFISICLLFSGFFSGAETALTSLNELKVKHLMEEKGIKAKNLELWLMHPNKVLTTILVGNNIANILGSVLAADLSIKIFHNSAIAITTGVMTFLVLIFGEITPKTFAKHNAVTMSIATINILKLFYRLFYPISFFLNTIASWLIKMMGGSVEKKGPKITENELEFLISVSEKEGVLENQKKEMLHSIFEISDTYAKEVLIPRTEMIAISVKASIDSIVDLAKETGYSRIPVYEGRLDNIIGILYVKDLLKFFIGDLKQLDLKKILRKVYFIPETKKLDDLLREFQLKRIHLAIVIDEYGGVAGLVTLEDIIEEIVGEIRDEYDTKEEANIIKTGDDVYRVDAGINIEDFCDYFELERTEDMSAYETVGGLIYDLAGKIPEINDEYQLDGYTLVVLTKEERTLNTIEIKKNNHDNVENDEKD